jgi:archaellum component FlaF (FlaF/FlaG flagellin family)
MSSSLSSEVTVNQSNIIVKVTNNGTEAVKYPEVYVLFFDADGNFINQGTTYAADDEGELKPGASKDVQLYTPSGYASHQIYLRGYK